MSEHQPRFDVERRVWDLPDMLETTLGVVQAADLECDVYTLEDDEKIETSVTYLAGGEVVHRSGHVHIKKSILQGLGETGGDA